MRVRASRPRAGRPAASVLALILCALAPFLHAQVFRARVSLRVVDVVVTGPDGRPVTGLGAGDFEVLEDGEACTVRFVTPVSIPEIAPAMDRAPGAPDDIWTNTAMESRRIFAIVIDDLSTRASETARARAVVRRFLDRVPEGDLVSVVFTGQQAGAQEFTSDKARLDRILEKYVGRNAIPDVDLVTDRGSQSMAMVEGQMLQGEALQNASRTLQTLVNVTGWLASVQDRRKAVLFVTDDTP